MSLTARERRTTSAELHHNLRLAGTTPDRIAVDLGLDAGRVHAVLDVTGAHPADVWLVRDFLDRAVLASGGTPAPYTVLTEEARAAADRWFGLADVDDVIARAARQPARVTEEGRR